MRAWAWLGRRRRAPTASWSSPGSGVAVRDWSPRLVHGHSRVRAPRDDPDAPSRGQVLALVRAGPAQTSALHALTVVRATSVSEPGQRPGHPRWAPSLATPFQQGLGKQKTPGE